MGRSLMLVVGVPSARGEGRERDRAALGVAAVGEGRGRRGE
jgi:hypothetical protein